MKPIDARTKRILIAVSLASIAIATTLAVADDVASNSLRVSSSGGSAHLAWGAASAPYSIYRSTNPAGLTRRANAFDSTSALTYDDTIPIPPGTLYFYSVGDPQRCLDAEACNGVDDTCDGQVDEGLGSFTCGVGACQRTVSACSGGTVAACVPGAPAASETCGDGIDNNCNGEIDEGCSCIYVSMAGNDSLCTGSSASPCRTIAKGINLASLFGVPRVCAGVSPICSAGNPASVTYNESVLMVNGVSVYGGYQTSGSTWPQVAGCTTVIGDTTAAGVSFVANVQSTTILAGFTVNGAASNPTAAAITVDGATGVQLAKLIVNGAGISSSRGVNLINGGQATITNSLIRGGSGTTESIGVRSVGAHPIVTGNCLSIEPVSGRCDDDCTATGSNPGIAGRSSNTGQPATSYAVYLQDSPNSVVDSSALCAVTATQGAGVRVAGDGAGVVIRGNQINASGGQSSSYGVWLEDCGGKAPWVVANQRISAQSAALNGRLEGVHVVGDCHPVIDQNFQIFGAIDSPASQEANGVYCGYAPASGVASRCAVTGNTTLHGLSTSLASSTTSAGVRCEGGACWRITGNADIKGQRGGSAYGLYLDASGPLVDNNIISGGDGAILSVGTFAKDSWARLQNNRIFAGFYFDEVGPVSLTAYGLQVTADAGTVELDVNSNDIDGSDMPPSDNTSAGLSLDVGTNPPVGGSGVFRNNIIRAGSSALRYNVAELQSAADPRIFENNDLDPSPPNPPTALYLDENLTSLATVNAVNALVDMVVAANISADPLYFGYPVDVHIQVGSPCDNAGTPVGAPARDMDGQLRGATPDIGADDR